MSFSFVSFRLVSYHSRGKRQVQKQVSGEEQQIVGEKIDSKLEVGVETASFYKVVGWMVEVEQKRRRRGRAAKLGRSLSTRVESE